ncbi:hypothetical protein GCM10011408_10610 [Dyella caseinilytica]|nr:hypothetical protein GCM10011408_10610 [Dyella caseinilytica]
MGLQLAELDRQRIELSVRVVAQITQLLILLPHLFVQRVDFRQCMVTWTGYGQRYAGAEAGQRQYHGRPDTQDAPA